MRHGKHKQLLVPIALGLGLGLLPLAACGGSSASAGGLELVSISVQDGQIWQINRPIRFKFNKPVAFGTINSSSISVSTIAGKPALGEYRSLSPTVVEFQPRCPTKSDLSDAGLEPGGVSYEVVVVGSDVKGGISVAATSGDVMKTSQKRTFQTPISTNPSQVFFDLKSGAPALIVREPGSDATSATFMQLGQPGDVSKRVYFENQGGTTGIVLEESDLLEDDPLDATIQLAPFNKFVATGQNFSLELEFDQPVSPADTNISSDRIELQYLDSGTMLWQDLDTTVVLVKNCTATGARVRVTPVGVIPPGAEVRLRISSAFQDLVGQSPLLDATALDFATAPPATFNGTQTVGDDFFEPFDLTAGQPGSFEDPAPAFADPVADWSSGSLRAVFDFIGTGGPGGNFDFRLAAGETLLIDTDGTTIVQGGPNFASTTTQSIVNGVFNVRDLLVETGATIRAEGANSFRVFATGSVTIEGRVDASGFDSGGVEQLASANLPEIGSLGACGGGRGGTGSPLTTASSPKGGDGFGFQNQPGAGGQGGETGYNGTNNDASRRPGGGGGGFYALNVAVVGDADECTAANEDCLNAEPGTDGPASSFGAITKTEVAKGGAIGPSVFLDGIADNDFFGTRLVPAGANGVGDPLVDEFIVGELQEPQAGPGGGGGGDNVKATDFPPLPFDPTTDLKGAGGGGGAGTVRIVALQEIVFGPMGSIVADGGWGGRGESISGGINNMGGGSGAGAGGHVIVQSASYIDFSQVDLALVTDSGDTAPSQDDPLSNTNVDDIKWRFIAARGGRGGPGGGNSFSTGFASGGDGGAGVIQLHVPDTVVLNGTTLEHPRIVPPGGTWDAMNQTAVPPATSANLNQIIDPNPYVLVPTVSARSRARSTFVPLGGAGQNTFSPVDQVLYFFDGIEVADPMAADFGQVLTTSQVVDDGTEIPVGAVTAIDATGRVVTLDATNLLSETAGDFPLETWIREPALLRSGKLTLASVPPGLTGRYTVANAAFDEGTGELTLTLDNETQGSALSSFAVGTVDATVNHRSFRVRTSAALDGLPDSASVTIRFQGVADDGDGNPDELDVLVPKQVAPDSPKWTSDITEFNAPDLLGDVKFFRFEVVFDIDANGSGLSANSPKPRLEFLRIPLRY